MARCGTSSTYACRNRSQARRCTGRIRVLRRTKEVTSRCTRGARRVCSVGSVTAQTLPSVRSPDTPPARHDERDGPVGREAARAAGQAALLLGT